MLRWSSKSSVFGSSPPSKMNHALPATCSILTQPVKNSQNLTGRALFDNINENEFTMSFMYPLFYNLFKYSKKVVIRWGEAKLISRKKEEHDALDDDDRRTQDQISTSYLEA
ncbi:hypothetical protein V8B55DRAFT_1179744 [Mucor lusitanicus]